MPYNQYTNREEGRIEKDDVMRHDAASPSRTSRRVKSVHFKHDKLEKNPFEGRKFVVDWRRQFNGLPISSFAVCRYC